MDRFIIVSEPTTKSPSYRTSSPKNGPLSKVASYKKRIGTAALKESNKTRKSTHKGEKSFKIYEDADCKEEKPKKDDHPRTEVVDGECQTESSSCFCSCHSADKSRADTSVDLGSSIAFDPEEEAYRKMIQEEVPDDYWHWVGEAHNKTEMFNQTLEEALQLADEVEKLKEKNAQLAKEASFSSYFASVVECMLDVLPEDSGIAEVSKHLISYRDITKDQSSTADRSSTDGDVGKLKKSEDVKKDGQGEA